MQLLSGMTAALVGSVIAAAAILVAPLYVDLFQIMQLTVFAAIAVLALSLGFIWGYEGIQPSILGEIVDTLKALRSRGLSLVFVEQNLEFVAALSGRVLIIQKGAITGEPLPQDLKNLEMVLEFVEITTA